MEGHTDMIKMPCKDCICVPICKLVFLDDKSPNLKLGKILFKCELLSAYLIIRCRNIKRRQLIDEIRIHVNIKRLNEVREYMKNV